MWSKLTCLLLLGVVTLSAREIIPDPRAAGLAHARLDPEGWAQVVVIGNTSPRREYPAETWATVFELEGRLWIYLPREGTRSLSRFEGRMESDKDDLREVLEQVHSGFTSYRIQIPDGAGLSLAATSEAGPLPNGCLVDAVAQYYRFRTEDPRVLGGMLLMYYGGRVTRWGHTVLCFETAKGWFYWDSKDAETIGALGSILPADTVRLARMTAGDRVGPFVSDARILPLGG